MSVASARGDDSSINLTIVIVSWNTREMLAECLERLPAAAGRVCHETVVVDNGSTDGTIEMIRETFPSVKLVENSDNAGFAAATNQGIRLASGRFVAFVNSDIMLPASSLDTLTSYLEQSPGIAAVGPQLVGRAGHLQYSGGYAPSPLSALNQLAGLQALLGGRSRGLFVRSKSQGRPMDVDWLCAACMVVRKEAIDSEGLLDDEHFMYAEDVEYGVRLRRGGWKLQLLPWVRVLHYGGASSAAIPEARLLWLGGLFRVAAGQMKRPRFNVFGLLMSAAYFARYVLVATGRLLPIVSERINEEVASNEDMRLYARTALELSLHDPEYAVAYSSRLEESCRRARKAEGQGNRP